MKADSDQQAGKNTSLENGLACTQLRQAGGEHIRSVDVAAQRRALELTTRHTNAEQFTDWVMGTIAGSRRVAGGLVLNASAWRSYLIRGGRPCQLLGQCSCIWSRQACHGCQQADCPRGDNGGQQRPAMTLVQDGAQHQQVSN